MILSFADAETGLIWADRQSRKLPPDIQSSALRKLRLMNAAKVLDDLRIPPGNRLEALKGNLKEVIRSGSMINGASALSGKMMAFTT